MTMKSRNLHKSWNSPGNLYSKVWVSADVSRVLMGSWKLDSLFSLIQASIWNSWSSCEDRFENNAPSYIPFLQVKKPYKNPTTNWRSLAGLKILHCWIGFPIFSPVDHQCRGTSEKQPEAAGRGQTGPWGVWILHQPLSPLWYSGEEVVRGLKGSFLYVHEKAKPH